MTTFTLLDRFVGEGRVPSRAAEIQNRLAVVRAQRGELTDRRSELLPIEADAIFVLNRSLCDLRAEEGVLTQDAMLLSAGYTEMSLDPLRWRNQQGLPSFAIFSIESPECMFCIQVGRKGYGRRFPEQIISPKGLENTGALFRCYEDVMAMMRQRVLRRRSVRGCRIRARFSGVIPDSTRTRIRQAQSLNVFTHIFIISEVDWKLEEIPVDPLVVGWNGSKLWLLDKFDITPLEALSVQAFATLAS